MTLRRLNPMARGPRPIGSPNSGRRGDSSALPVPARRAAVYKLLDTVDVPVLRPHIGHASFLVFKDVEDFALHCGALEFVARKRGVRAAFALRVCGVAYGSAAAERNDVILFVSMLAQPQRK